MKLNLKKFLSKKIIIGAIIAMALIASSAMSKPASQSTSEPPSHTTTATQKEVRIITETETIPFDTRTESDPTLDYGKTVITSPGELGEKSTTYQATFIDGIEKDRIKSGEQITKQPISKITKVGTRTTLDCPNGTYTNSSGNTVCSPFMSSSVPSGATAQCSDGTYSYSQSRRGTCSHHGGVSVWY